MVATDAPVAEQLRHAVSTELLRLAAQEEDVAACEAEHVHYWEAMPGSVLSHRQAAAALRAAAEDLLP